MIISYEIKGITLNEDDLFCINQYYEAACTAEYIAENYGLDEELALKLGYEIRMKMDKYGYEEEEAIKVILKEKKEENIMQFTENNPFFGKTVVVTGKFQNYTREGIQNKLISLGANPASSVTRKTDYIIVGENAGSKLTKALQLGIRTLTEEEFEAKLAGE